MLKYESCNHSKFIPYVPLNYISDNDNTLVKYFFVMGLFRNYLAISNPVHVIKVIMQCIILKIDEQSKFPCLITLRNTIE